MILKFAASDDLKILQAEVISECEGLLNVSMRMCLTILCLQFLSNLQFDFHNELPLKIKIKLYLVVS